MKLNQLSNKMNQLQLILRTLNQEMEKLAVKSKTRLLKKMGQQLVLIVVKHY